MPCHGAWHQHDNGDGRSSACAEAGRSQECRWVSTGTRARAQTLSVAEGWEEQRRDNDQGWMGVGAESVLAESAG